MIDLIGNGEFGFKKRKRESTTVEVDREALERCYGLYMNRPEAQACVNAIRRRLLARGIEIVKNGMDITPEFQAHVNEYYTRFCADVIETALVAGVVPYVLRKSPSGLHYPHVVPPLALKFEADCDHAGCMQYRVTDKSVSGKVMFAVFNPLTLQGQPSSPTASLLPAHDFLYAQEVNVFIANEIAARPPVFMRAESSTITNREVAQMDSYAPGVVAETEMAGQLMRNRIQMSILQTQKQHLAALAGGKQTHLSQSQFAEHRDRLTGMPVVDFSRGTSFVPELFPLPEGTRVENLQLPHAPGSVEEYRSHFVDLCCMAYNVPRHIITGGEAARASSSSAMLADSSIRNTLDFFRNKLAFLCLEAYKTLHGDSSDDVRVVFPSNSDIVLMQRLYAEGLLKHNAYVQALANYMDIPQESFNSEKEMEAKLERMRPQKQQQPEPSPKPEPDLADPQSKKPAREPAALKATDG